MASVEAVMVGARTYMRDNPRFFTATVAKSGLTLTFKMPHRNLMSTGFLAVGSNGTIVATGVHQGNDTGTAVATVTLKALTTNVATLTTAAPHGYRAGQTVVVAGVDATFNGTYVIVAVPTPTTFTYAKVNADIVSGAATGTASVTGGNIFTYVLDEAEGLVRIATPINGGFQGEWSFNFEGYRYQWVGDADLRYFANNIVAEHAYHRTDFDMALISDVEEDCMALGAAVEAFWSLLAEYSRDIDVNTPEGISVPATQRFRQLEGMLMGRGGLVERYKTKANMIGVGMERIEMMTLRRVSRTTNRLVPVYRPQEWDDANPRHRVFPVIDEIAPSTPPPSFAPAGSVQGTYDTGGMVP